MPQPSPGPAEEPGPSAEVAALAEALNEVDYIERAMFGDAVNAAIVRNVKAAALKGQRVSLRGLARVLGLQPSTVRRRVAALVEAGWIEHTHDAGLRYTPEGFRRGQPAARRVLTKFAHILTRLGWGDFRPPPG